jgi:hypothetical protein
MIDPDIKQRMEALPRQYREFIYSGFATEAANILGSAEDLRPEQVKVFESSILLYLLFFIKKGDIVEILVNEGVSEKAVTGLVYALEESLPSFAKQNDVTLSEEESMDELENEIFAAEHALEALQNVRTMPHDMASIRPGSDVVYQSNQADILRPVEPQPTPAPPEPPRWESDTKQ